MFKLKARKQRRAAESKVESAKTVLELFEVEVEQIESAHRAEERQREEQLAELRSLAYTLRSAIGTRIVHPRIAGLHARAQLELEQVERAIAEIEAAPVEPSEELRAARRRLEVAEEALQADHAALDALG